MAEGGRPAEATIAAIASAPGPGARGVIRVSGARAGELAAATLRCPGATGAPGPPELAGRALLRGRFLDGRGEQPALLLWMPGPRSYTGEDVAELHLPGSPPLLAAALERLLALGARAAEPGEFTRRAFLAGRIDLTRAEGVLELVAAGSEEERRAATALLTGGLARRVAELREGLEELRALCEASLDFDASETGHVPAAELDARAGRLAAALDDALAWEVRREPASGLPRVLLVGAPNAGKSSLFNRLAGADALVSPLAGTTRDVLEAVWRPGGTGGAGDADRDDAGGAPACLLVDGPGIEAVAAGPEGAADRAAQELAGRERGGASLLLWVVDASDADPARLAAQAAGLPAGVPLLPVWNKTDLEAPPASAVPPDAVAVSAATGAGLEQLAARVAERLGGGGPGGPGGPGAGLGRELSARHRRSLAEAAAELAEARLQLAADAPLDLVAEALRGSSRALDGITGETTPEDLLDRIFARFCLGK